MSLIPFILDLADELHQFNRNLTAGMEIDDFGFGIYPHEQSLSSSFSSSSSASSSASPPTQQQHHQHHLQQPHYQQQASLSPQRRARLASPFYWVPALFKQRHHPYNRGAVKTACCNKSVLELEKELLADKESTSAGTGSAASNVAAKSAYSVVNKNGFQVSMNVKQFAPDELTVKTIDNCIVVEGQHDEKEDGHGVISRHFIRKYMLPKGYDPNEVLSTLSSDGILTVKAPPPPPPAAKGANEERAERSVDIQQTGGPAHLSPIKDAQSPLKEQPKLLAANVGKEQQQQQQPQQQQQQQQQTDVQKSASVVPAAAATTATTLTAAEERNGDVDSMSAPDTAVQCLETSNGDNNTVAAATTAAAVVAAKSVESVEPMQCEVSADTTAAANATTNATTATTTAKSATEKTATGNEIAEKTSTNPAVAEITEDANANINANGAAATAVATSAVQDANAVDDADVDMTAVANTTTNCTNSSKLTTNTTITHLDENVVQNLVAAAVAAPPKAAELIAAADAAILLAKAQVENVATAAAAVVAVAAPVPVPTEEIAN